MKRILLRVQLVLVLALALVWALPALAQDTTQQSTPPAIPEQPAIPDTPENLNDDKGSGDQAQAEDIPAVEGESAEQEPVVPEEPPEVDPGEGVPPRSTERMTPVVEQTDLEEVEDVETLPVQVPEPSAKATRYYRSGNLLWVAGQLIGAAILLLVLFLGWSGKLRDLAYKVSRRWWFAFAVYFVLVVVVISLLALPLEMYSGFFRQHAYGLSTESFGGWLKDWALNLMVTVIFGLLFAWIPFRLIKRQPKRWWLWFGIGSLPVMAFIMLISPVFVDPLFNDFEPMKDHDLEAKLLTLADRAGIGDADVFEVDKSTETTTVNAYVTGIGSTKRIVLWDTIIAKLEDRELLFVMAHEMGHYVLGHVWKFILILAVLITFGFWVIHLTGGWALQKWGDRFGVHELGDFASLPLMLLLLGIVFFLLMPAINGYSRSIEHDADTFGLELTRDNYAAATAFVELQQQNLANPRPGWLYKLWRSSHPPLGERIDFCNRYKPWETGEPMRYDHLFRSSGVAGDVEE